MTNTSKGLLITALGALIMSFESLFIKFITLSPLEISFYIGVFMFISTFSILLVKKREVLKSSFDKTFKYALLAAFLMCTSNLFFISAVKNTDVANVVLILAIAPIFASFFSFLIYKIKPKKNIYVASLFIFLGLFIIFHGHLGQGNMKGNIYALCCAIFFSLVFVVLSKHTSLNRIFLIAINGLFLAISSFLLNGFTLIDKSNLLIIIIMGVIITPISRILIANGTKFLSASEVSLLMIIETVMAPIWVWIFLKEIPSSNTFVGGALIIATLIINSIYNMKQVRTIKV